MSTNSMDLKTIFPNAAEDTPLTKEEMDHDRNILRLWLNFGLAAMTVASVSYIAFLLAGK